MTDPKGNSQFCFPRVSRGNKTRCFFQVSHFKVKSILLYIPTQK